MVVIPIIITSNDVRNEKHERECTIQGNISETIPFFIRLWTAGPTDDSCGHQSNVCMQVWGAARDIIQNDIRPSHKPYTLHTEMFSDMQQKQLPFGFSRHYQNPVKCYSSRAATSHYRSSCGHTGQSLNISFVF